MTLDYRNQYVEFIKNVEIDDIFLLELKTKRMLEDIVGLTTDTNIKVNTSIVGRSKEQLAVALSLDICANLKKEENQEPCFTCNATFIAKYKFINRIELDDSVEKEIIDEFVRRNVPINVWPYCRELVASTSLKMSLPAFILPIVKVI